MTEAIYFPDPVALVISAVSDGLAGLGWSVPVRKRVPNPRPSAFMTVQRTGGVTASMVTDTAQLTVECWADLDTVAADLAIDARALVNGLASSVLDGTQVYRVTELSGPADLPDPLSDQARMTWSVTVQLRGTTTRDAS